MFIYSEFLFKCNQYNGSVRSFVFYIETGFLYQAFRRLHVFHIIVNLDLFRATTCHEIYHTYIHTVCRFDKDLTFDILLILYS